MIISNKLDHNNHNSKNNVLEKHMKINAGITIWLAVVIVVVIVVGISMSYIVSDYFKQTILKRDVDVNAKFISLQARQHLADDDFVAKNFVEKDKVFSQFFHEIDTDEIVRIKVWSLDRVVVYSDEKDIVGKTFRDNDELNEALNGKVISEISDLQKSESASEKNFVQLVEIYIPIKSDSGKIIGVIETYASMDLINTYIENVNKIIFPITIIGISAIGAIILLTFSNFRRNVILPILAIHKETKMIEEGKLDIRYTSAGYDEVKKLGSEIEVMAAKLKEQQMKMSATERLSAIGQLSARLAHDLRNPLSVIQNSLALIQHKYGINPDSQNDFDRINRSIWRMSHQLENVMDFVTTKELKVVTKSLNEIMHMAIKKANISDNITVNLPTEDVLLECDPKKLEIVFENILVNARQAINGVGIINIRVDHDENSVRIEIRDSGVGMSKEILAKIFEPLFTTKQEGTGLGLPSCKNIIERHGGSISVKTELGKGTIFTITLPISKKIHFISTVKF